METITRDGVITQIQSLNRLQTIAFSVDTIITSQRQGNWYRLWQDEQKGLFVAHGRVIAGVDLNKLTAEQVQVSETDNGTQIEITIPKAEVFSVYLDDIEVYDLDTGLFGLVKADPDIFRQAQISGKQQVLKTACEGHMMTMALDNAQKQIQSLFSLTGATVIVHNQGVGNCSIVSQS
ncbi:DUF4230 domain-containing protein [Psychrobacter sp. I-STPA6b]|uniref:DUF4230 domain-containing protein n=1 Tax=Psychrobacter sp. I-STPA6b TaxID=2585718 RepID=UPI0029CABD52|nr:DUF4230 domain-containing protein [Psychrobacter sp. I-STPA6b]